VRAASQAAAIGFLDDTPDGVDRELLDRALALAFERVGEGQRFARPFELLYERVDGLPWGSARAVEEGFAALVERGALVILGPAMGDSALVATELAEAAGVPALNWAGTEEARGEYMFQLQVGSHEEEPVVLAQHLASRGIASAALVFERSTIGSRYARFFDEACLSAGLELAARVGVPPAARDLAPALATARRSEAQALVYLGLGLAVPLLVAELRRQPFEGPRLCNSCGMFGWLDPARARDFEGWTYVDVVSEENPVLQEAGKRLGADFARGPHVACYHDLARLAAEGLARAPELTARGVRDGLERIKLLPAALGARGTVMGFGHLERSALKGPYLVLRSWRGARSVELEAGAPAGPGRAAGS
jgi:ABC-type branched-subunit amino acid transport system substrate-binding protein